MKNKEIKHDESPFKKDGFPMGVLDYQQPVKYKLGISGKNGWKPTIYINNSHGNCKVCTIEKLEGAINTVGWENREDIAKRLIELFNGYRKLVFFTTFTSTEYIDFMKEHFKLAYAVSVPIGYGNDEKQYHCLFYTGHEEYSNYEKYLNRFEEEGIKLVD